MNDIAERIAALRSNLQKAGAQAYVIPSSDPHLSEYTPAHWQTRKYFSGFTGSAGTLVVTRKRKAASGRTAATSYRPGISWREAASSFSA